MTAAAAPKGKSKAGSKMTSPKKQLLVVKPKEQEY
jgi:hypothetical protein